MHHIWLAIPLLALALGGCLARTAVDIVSLPVKATGSAVDMATTSQSEADEKRGREIRKREERYGELGRDWRKADAKCRGGNDQACRQREAIYAEMEQLRATIPNEPSRG